MTEQPSDQPAAMSQNAPPADAFWDQRFSAPGYLFGTAPNAYLQAQQGHFRAGMRALAVADGEGRNSVWLARQGLLVDAFDISDVAVGKARELARQAGVALDCQRASWQTFAWRPATYDLVAGIFIQFAPPGEREQLFARMREALRPGGLLVVQGYTPEQLNYRTGGPGQLGHLYTAEWLVTQCQGLEILDLTQATRVLQEGSAHLGLSAVIGLTARRPG